FFSSRRRHTRSTRDWSSDVCSSDLAGWKNPLSSELLNLPARPPFTHGPRLWPLPLRLSPGLTRSLIERSSGFQAFPTQEVRFCQIGRASCRERGYVSVVAGA